MQMPELVEDIDVNLSASIVNGILRSLKSDIDEKARAEGRIHPRVGLRAVVRIFKYPLDRSDRGTEVYVRDLSRGGVSFLQSRSHRAKGQFVIRFPQADDGPVVVLCDIVHDKPIGKDLNIIGARFTMILAGSLSALQTTGGATTKSAAQSS